MAVDGAKFQLSKLSKSLEQLKKELPGMSLIPKFEEINKKFSEKTITASPEESLKLLCRVNNLLAECRIFAHRCNQLNKNIINFIPLTRWWFQRRKRQKLNNLLNETGKILEDTQESSARPQRMLQTTRMNGFDKMASEIEKVLLREGGEDFTAYGITGMAGTGKTALAQQVFDSDQIRNTFRRRIWVSLSDRGDSEGQSKKTNSLIKIMKCILKELNDDPDDVLKVTEHTDFFEVFVEMQNRLSKSKHKCLIVIDDIWQEKELYKSVCRRMSEEKAAVPKGGAIIVTSRQEDLVKRMVSRNGYTTRLDHQNQPLKEDCWKIFEDAVKKEGIEKMDPQTLEKIEGDIKYKIQGLPLAAETLAKIIPQKYEMRVKSGSERLIGEVIYRHYQI